MVATTDTLETFALADQLRRLVDRVPLSEREVALATGADEPTVAAWLRRETAPSGKAATRLAELIAVVETLEQVTRPEAIGPWLARKVPALHNGTPAAVIASGGYEQVYEIAAELAAGTFT